MSKIGSIVNKGKFIKQEKIKDCPSTTQQPLTTTEENIEQFIKSAEDKLGGVVGQAKEEIMKPIDEFLKEHPSLELFIPALIAGGVAGWLDKKIEEKKVMTDYMKKLDSFTGQVERQVKYHNAKKKVVSLNPLVSPEAAAAYCPRGPAPFLTVAVMNVISNVGAIACNMVRREKILSDDGQFLMYGHHKFVTVPPSNDKLIFYEVKKVDKEKKLVPLKEVKLDHKVNGLSLEHSYARSFYVNYENAKTEFSFDGVKK